MPTLFEDIQTDDQLKPLGKNYAIKVKSGELIEIFHNGQFQKVAKIAPNIEKRLIVIDLVERCGVEKKKLADALGISRQSIDTWIKTYQKRGTEGLVNNTKDSWKKNPRRFTGNKARELEEENKAILQEKQKHELCIDFQDDSTANQIYPIYKELFSEEHDYQGNRYAGSFLFWPMFDNYYDINKFLNKHIGENKIVIFLFAVMQINRIFSIEQLKTVYKEEFGKFLGLKNLPSAPELWKRIHEHVNQTKETSKKTLKAFFKHQILRGIVGVFNLFIDGHFIPYYGKEKVHKGWYTQRGMAMPGITAIYAHDQSGRVAYFDIFDGKADIVSTVKEIHEDWKDLNMGICPLIAIDREIWGVDNFCELQPYNIVTWEKFSDEAQLYEIAESAFCHELTWQKKKYKISEDQKTYKDNEGNQIKMRRLVYWKTSVNQRFAIVTTDKESPAPEVAQAMLNRWGSNENTFKYMNKRVGMHYNPVFNISRESENQQIKNPEHAEAAKQITNIKNQIRKCEQGLGKINITIDKAGALRKNKSRDKLQLNLSLLKTELQVQQTNLEALPQFTELEKVTGETYKTYSTDGKVWWDLSGALVWNSRKKLIEIFSNYVPDNRDTIPVLEAIIRGNGWIKTTKTTVTVRLEPLERKSYHSAQIQLCRHLNTLKTKLGDGKILLFDVAPNPYNVQK
ncbi:MAG: helix-turn-helix domain-containing protein [Acetobacterium sp.]|nr:helix-turn-helix domain-containing protein [Acetobacterium sp.]